MSLAKYIDSLQKSKSTSGPSRSVTDPCLTSGYISDESDDSSFSFVSADDSLFLNDDMESDGKAHRHHREQSGVKLLNSQVANVLQTLSVSSLD